MLAKLSGITLLSEQKSNAGDRRCNFSLFFLHLHYTRYVNVTAMAFIINIMHSSKAF
jgi:hypothetical protein